MKNILVGADLTANGESAFVRAIQLAQLAGARLHVVHVDRRLQIPGMESETAAHQSELRNRLRQFVQSRSGPGGIHFDIYLETRGRTYEVIDERARKTGADLIVVGRSKRLGAVPGSVLLTSGQVVTSSDCPVLVVTQPVSGNYTRIVLESPLSRSSEKAVMSAVSGFGPDVELTVLQGVIGSSDRDGLMAGMQRRLHNRRYASFVARTVRILRKHGLPDQRLSIKEIEQDPLDSLLCALVGGRFDVVVLMHVRRRLRAPEIRERLVKAVPAATCDALFLWA